MAQAGSPALVAEEDSPGAPEVWSPAGRIEDDFAARVFLQAQTVFPVQAELQAQAAFQAQAAPELAEPVARAQADD